jgi:[ribosomal protein S5]-alanine N-acetyltransferase
MEYKELTTTRLVLREFMPGDLSFIYEHFSDKNVSRYLYDNEPPSNINEAKKIFQWCMDKESSDHIRWCITLKHNLKQIGTCGFHNYDNKNNAAEIGYDLSSDYWNKGYMTEALKKMLHYGYEVYSLNRIYACVYIVNIASNKLLEKLGFKHEGVIRDKHFFRGNYYDHNLYSLLRGEKGKYI